MTDDEHSHQGWAAIIAAVKTELGLLTLVVLVVGATFSALSRVQGVSSALLIVAFASIVLVVIIIAGALLVSRARTSRVEKLAANQRFAQLMGEEIFQAYDGSIKNLLRQEQQEAYETFKSYFETSQLFRSTDEVSFVRVFVETVMHRASQRSGTR